FSDVISGLLQQQRIRRNLRIPDGTLQNGSTSRAPKILPRKERTATGSAGRGVHKRIPKQDTFPSQAVEVRRPYHVIDPSRTVDLGIDVCLTSPVVGEGEQDIRTWASLRIGLPISEGEECEEDAKENAAHAMSPLRYWKSSM